MRKRKMCAALLISSMIPLCSLAQQLENKRVSLKLHNATVKVFFEKLREQTGLNFVYNNEQIKNVPLISIQGENMELKDALNKAFAKTSLVYYIDNNTVTLYQQEPTARRTIHGTVTDADGSPLPGANVKVKGAKTGSITDAEGRYTLSAPVPCELVISFIGMETQTIAYNGQNNVQNVKLNDDSKSIDEVVVNGYFTRKSEGFAGSVTTIKKEELQKIHTGNIFTTISALDAGFKITENNNM